MEVSSTSTRLAVSIESQKGMMIGTPRCQRMGDLLYSFE
jgi:hypothetical protein